MHKHLLHANAGDGYGLQELDDTKWLRHYNAPSYHFKKNVLKCDFEPVVKAKELPLASKRQDHKLNRNNVEQNKTIYHFLKQIPNSAVDLKHMLPFHSTDEGKAIIYYS